MTKSRQSDYCAAPAAVKAAPWPEPALKPQPVFGQALLRQRAVRHGFFTRCGGVSSGIYASLNLGFASGDTRQNVAENRLRAAQWLASRSLPLLTPHQFHSNQAITVTAPWHGAPPQGDALVSRLENCAIGVLTADCGAVLLADSQAGVIGAAHAGWRGALNGVLQNTVDAMLALGAKAENIAAAAGPSISPQNYEVGEEFRQAFMDKNAAYARYFTPWTGKKHNLPQAGAAACPAPSYHCDLWSFMHDRLAEKGVQTENLRLCTYADEARFFSFRRATHKGEPDYGRQLSAIALLPSANS